MLFFRSYSPFLERPHQRASLVNYFKEQLEESYQSQSVVYITNTMVSPKILDKVKKLIQNISKLIKEYRQLHF
jgi:transcription initiation factor IIE alpha subunit